MFACFILINIKYGSRTMTLVCLKSAFAESVSYQVAARGYPHFPNAHLFSTA